MSIKLPIAGVEESQAHLPRLKTLEEFDFDRCPKVSAQQIHELAEGSYLGRAEPVIFIGDSDPAT